MNAVSLDPPSHSTSPTPKPRIHLKPTSSSPINDEEAITDRSDTSIKKKKKAGISRLKKKKDDIFSNGSVNSENFSPSEVRK